MSRRPKEVSLLENRRALFTRLLFAVCVIGGTVYLAFVECVCWLDMPTFCLISQFSSCFHPDNLKFLFLVAMDGIYIGTPSRDEIKRCLSRPMSKESLPSCIRSEGDRDEIFSSEDELSESFEKFLKESLADKKAAKKQVEVFKAPEDPAIVPQGETIANEAEVPMTPESSVVIGQEEKIAEVETEVTSTPEDPTAAEKMANDVMDISDTVELAEGASQEEEPSTPITASAPAKIDQLEESATEDVFMTPDDDSHTVASKNWIVNSSIVIATPTVGDRKRFLQRCFKEPSKNESDRKPFDANDSFMAFIQKKKQELKKPNTIAEGEAEESNEM